MPSHVFTRKKLNTILSKWRRYFRNRNTIAQILFVKFGTGNLGSILFGPVLGILISLKNIHGYQLAYYWKTAKFIERLYRTGILIMIGFGYRVISFPFCCFLEWKGNVKIYNFDTKLWTSENSEKIKIDTDYIRFKSCR